jgi:drug/metabolite transporter (DMT)-like permease
MKSKSTYFLGVGSALISSIFFGMLGIFSSVGQDAGLSTTSRIFFRFLVAAIVLYIIIKIKHKDLRLPKGSLYKLVIGSILYFSLTSYLLFRAYDYIGTGFATVLSFTYPIMVLLMSIAIDKERVGRMQLLGTAMAFFGLVVVIGPVSATNALGVFLGLLSAITFTLYVRMLAKDYAKNLDGLVLMFYVFSISSIFWFFPSCIEVMKNPVPIDIYRASLSILGLAIPGTIVACTLFNYGVRNIGGRMTSILSIFDPLTSVLIGCVVLNEKLSDGFGYGVLFIIMGTVMVSLFEKKRESTNIVVINETAPPLKFNPRGFRRRRA